MVTAANGTAHANTASAASCAGLSASVRTTTVTALTAKVAASVKKTNSITA